MVKDELRRYDGLVDASGGMDSGRGPEVIDPTNVALGVNVVTRDGWPKTRPSFVRRSLFDDTWKKFAAGLFQGVGSYYNPATGAAKVLAVSSGLIYEIDAATFEIRELTPSEGGNDPNALCYFCQAESFLIIQNGEDYPLIYDGEKLRRVVKDSGEVPVGTIMAYGQGRLFVVSTDRTEIIAGDLVFGGSLSQVEILRSDKDVVSLNNHKKKSVEYSLTRVTTKKPHGLKAGDQVTIRRHNTADVQLNGTWFIEDVKADSFVIPLSATMYGAGGTVEKFSAGQTSDLLRFTETKYLNEKGVFRMRAEMGRITGMAFFPVQDTTTGQGDLLVLGEHGGATFMVSSPRETWLDIAIQKVALAQNGGTSPNSVVPVNSDIFFLSADGLRSFRNSAVEFSNSVGSTPLSTEISRILNFDSGELRAYASAAKFDNRLLFTVSPKARPLTDGNPFDTHPVTFSALAVLDFHNASRISKKGTPSYDGIWTGLDILQIFSARFGGVERCFAFSFTADRTTEMWEITRTSRSGCDLHDSPTRFAFLADGGNDSDNAKKVAALVKQQGATDVVLAGDTNYEGTATFDDNLGQHWQPFMFPFKGATTLKAGEAPARANHLWVCPGNHDWDQGDSLAAFLDYTNAPARYYRKKFGDVELFFLDSDTREPDGRTNTSIQRNWLVAALASSTARFKGVVLHHAPYTSGTNHGGSATMAAWNFHTLGAHFVVAGHEHVYERVMKSGVPYFVVGTGGASLTSFGTPVAGSESRVLKYGALFMDVDGDKLTFTFRDTNGKAHDTFTVSNPSDQPRSPRIVRCEKRVSCAIETRAFTFDTPFAKKKIVRGDLWLNEIQGNTRIRVFWRPDVHPYWFYWGAFDQSNADQNPANTTTPVVLDALPAPQIMMPTPPKIDDPAVIGRPAHLGHSFQVRLEWDGLVQIQKLLMHALEQPEATQATPPPSTAVAHWIPGQGNAVPQPKPTDLLAHSAR